jgi:hypothetical protein
MQCRCREGRIRDRVRSPGIERGGRDDRLRARLGAELPPDARDSAFVGHGGVPGHVRFVVESNEDARNGSTERVTERDDQRLREQGAHFAGLAIAGNDRQRRLGRWIVVRRRASVIPACRRCLEHDRNERQPNRMAGHMMARAHDRITELGRAPDAETSLSRIRAAARPLPIINEGSR